MSDVTNGQLENSKLAIVRWLKIAAQPVTVETPCHSIHTIDHLGTIGSSLRLQASSTMEDTFDRMCSAFQARVDELTSITRLRLEGDFHLRLIGSCLTGVRACP